MGVSLDAESSVFSLAPDHSTHLIPSSVTQRFRKLAGRLGLDTHIHQLRHYSATELISAGVDIRTVAGRLGHAGGGTTTLRAYAAWMAEADQRAAAALSPRMPGEGRRGVAVPKSKASSPYERIAADLRSTSESGVLGPVASIPTVATPLPPNTAHRSAPRRRAPNGRGPPRRPTAAVRPSIVDVDASVVWRYT